MRPLFFQESNFEKETSEYARKSCLGSRSNTALVIFHSFCYTSVFEMEQSHHHYILGV
jgi:hypothetical protein